MTQAFIQMFQENGETDLAPSDIAYADVGSFSQMGYNSLPKKFTDITGDPYEEQVRYDLKLFSEWIKEITSLGLGKSCQNLLLKAVDQWRGDFQKEFELIINEISIIKSQFSEVLDEKNYEEVPEGVMTKKKTKFFINEVSKVSNNFMLKIENINVDLTKTIQFLQESSLGKGIPVEKYAKEFTDRVKSFAKENFKLFAEFIPNDAEWIARDWRGLDAHEQNNEIFLKLKKRWEDDIIDKTRSLLSVNHGLSSD